MNFKGLLLSNKGSIAAFKPTYEPEQENREEAVADPQKF